MLFSFKGWGAWRRRFQYGWAAGHFKGVAADPGAI
jgi:hypothetical protein